MSPKLLPANNLARSTYTGQVTDEGVEPKPALRRAREPLLPDLGPSPLHPQGGTGRHRAARGTPASVRNARYRLSSSRCSAVRVSSTSTANSPALTARR